MSNRQEKYSKKGTKVFVGLSGGVDSAVSAALLKNEGYDVTGVFIKAWTPAGYPCTWKEDRRSAMRAAAFLDIPFLTLDLEQEYKREVVDYMIDEYKMGRTPNPDVMCNKEIKFGHFLKFALANGADFVATGHYAQKLKAKSLELRVKSSNSDTLSSQLSALSYILSEAKDKNKDQSYFLWTLTQDQLKHVLFPVGHLQKKDVRQLAHKFGLPQETRKDSQGLCFLGKIDMKEFLSQYIELKKGDVLDQNNKVIGYHRGALFFTIGERHGFVITQKTDQDVPLYVVAKNVKENTIVVAPRSVSQRDKENLFKKNLVIENINWVSGREPDLSKKYLTRVRYRGEKIGCKIKKEASKTVVNLDTLEQGISPGQSLVFYLDEICIGGGIISG